MGERTIGDDPEGMDEPHLNGHSHVLPRIVHGAKEADDRFVSFVHERPIVAICVAAAVGYVLGRAAMRLVR